MTNKTRIYFLVWCLCMPYTVFSASTHKLKILFATTYFPAFSGRFILNIMTELIDAGHDVYIYAKHKGAKWPHPNIQRYNLMKKVFYKEVPKQIQTFDIIFAQFGYRGEEWARILEKMPKDKRPKLVTCFRGADLTRFLRKKPSRYDRLFKVGDLFLPVCDYFKNKLIALGCDPHKIITHHSAIDCNVFKPAQKREKNDTIIITSVSRLVEKKGIDYAIYAIKKLIKKEPNIHYYIVGFGNQEEKLRELVALLKLENYITFLGRRSEQEIVTLLHKTDIFILPSITAHDGDQEGIPNALKEAMACEVPVIATHHAGNNELVNNTCGFLIPEKNSAVLAERIYMLLQDPELRMRMGAHGRQIVLQDFEMHTTNKKLLMLFESLITTH